MSAIIQPEWIKFLNEWQLRILVLISLLLQIFLIVTGNRRKYISKNWLRFMLWLFYLSADWVATVALGILSHGQSDDEKCKRSSKPALDPNYVLRAFWAPFLLVHLGGPDAITAYALADNDLWLRHLLGLFVQVGIAGYVFFRSWEGSPVNYLGAVIFAAGLIKYGERTWALSSASRDGFRKSMVSDPDPGPNYAKFMDDYISKKAEGYRVSLGKAIDEYQVVHHPNSPESNLDAAATLRDAFYFFGTFKKLFADLILSFQDRKSSRSFFQKQVWDRAYRLVEVELGLIYDIFYTKTFQLLSPLGIVLRLVGVSLILVVFIFFPFISKDHYSTTDVVITYILLVGAIILEMYAILILLSSDGLMIWLSGNGTMLSFVGIKDCVAFATCKAVSFFRFLGALPAIRRWSGTMGQYNLLTVCLKDKLTTFEKVQQLFRIYELLERTRHRYRVDIPKGLKQLVFNQLEARISSDVEANVQICTLRCDQTVLKDTKCFESTNGVDFAQSILTWHIATDLCYVKDHSNQNEMSMLEATEWLRNYIITDQTSSVENLRFKREISRLLSDYMLYLLIMCPFMLPSGLGTIRFQDTRAEAMEFFKDRKCFLGTKELACDKLLQINTEIAPSEVKGDRSKSVLFDACRLAKSLQSEEDENPGAENGEKWEKIFHVWVDLLSFSAANCDWKDHAEQLRRGGEFLTHVWLLMAHFGLTDHFQISQGYVRAKLSLK